MYMYFLTGVTMHVVKFVCNSLKVIALIDTVQKRVSTIIYRTTIKTL